MAEKKVRHALKDGPYAGKTVFLTAGVNTTLTFGLKGFYGRYVMKEEKTGDCMEWKEQWKDLHELTITGPIHFKRPVGREIRARRRERIRLENLRAVARIRKRG
jgi:hypothetical protein